MKTITTTNKHSAALRRGLAIVLMLILTTMLLTTFAFAADGEDASQATQASDISAAATTIEQGVKTGMGKVYGIITVIVAPIAAVCLGAGAFQFFFRGERGVEKAKSIWLYTVIGVALVYLAPVVVAEIASWFSSTGDAGIFD